MNRLAFIAFLLFAPIAGALAQFNGCPPGFCPGNLLGGAPKFNGPAWVLNQANPPDLAINWTNNQVWTKSTGLTTAISSLSLTTTRSTSATDLLPTSPAGYAYLTFGANTPVISPGVGRVGPWGLAVNLFLNSSVPVTQTVNLPATGNYTIWGNWPGAGTATVAAGTATITGAGSASQGSPLVINCTATGTMTVTLTGSPQAIQVESGAFGTSFIITSGTTASRAAESITMPATIGSSFTMFEQAMPYSPVSFASNQNFLQFDDGTASNRVLLRRLASGGVPGLLDSVGGTAIANALIGVTAWAQFANGKVAAAFTAGSQNGAFDQTNTTAQTGASVPTTTTTVRFGVDSTPGSQLNGTAQIDQFWFSQAVPASQLQSMTVLP